MGVSILVLAHLVLKHMIQFIARRHMAAVAINGLIKVNHYREFKNYPVESSVSFKVIQ